MRLVVHPGWSKTGTTAIQNYFARFYSDYIQGGVLYPAAGRYIDNAHHGLALAVAPRPGLSVDHTAEQVFEAIREEMTGASTQTLLLSSELSPNYFQHPLASAFFREFDRITIVFTVRQQSELITSLYKQIVKDPNIFYTGTVYDLLFENIPMLEFQRTVQSWAAASRGNQQVEIKIVRFSPKHLIADFVAAAEIAPLYSFTDQPNRSPSDSTALVLSATMEQRVGMSPAETEHFVAWVSEATSKVDLRLPLLTPHERYLIDGMYQKSNDDLARTYLGQDNLFPPPVLPHASEDKVTPLLDAFAQSIWARYSATLVSA